MSTPITATFLFRPYHVAVERRADRVRAELG
jgi:hypothetical protein